MRGLSNVRENWHSVVGLEIRLLIICEEKEQIGAETVHERGDSMKYLKEVLVPFK